MIRVLFGPPKSKKAPHPYRTKRRQWQRSDACHEIGGAAPLFLPSEAAHFEELSTFLPENLTAFEKKTKRATRCVQSHCPPNTGTRRTKTGQKLTILGTRFSAERPMVGREVLPRLYRSTWRQRDSMYNPAKYCITLRLL